jgi:hypothetical protein
LLEEILGDERRGLRARDEDGADDEIRALDRALDVLGVRVERLDAAAEDVFVSARTSSTVTCAPMPTAIVAALRPTTPPPRMTTRPRRVPGTPPKSTPLPPCAFSSDEAPTCTAMRPATSLIGRSSGSDPSSGWMVS